MSHYEEPFTFDFADDVIRVDAGVQSVDVTELYRAIQLAQCSDEGIIHERIAVGSGLEELDAGVFVGITVRLVGLWQVEFAAGAYIAKISGGNLVGGPGGDPIAYSPGVQVLLVQSAASTVVRVETTGVATTTEDLADAVWAHNQALVKATQLSEAHAMLGLRTGDPMRISDTGHQNESGDVNVSITQNPDGSTTLARL